MAWRKVLSIGLRVLSVGALIAGCVVSPQPSPPDAELDGHRILVQADLSATDSGVVVFRGGAGAVDPPRGAVIITNLDAADAPSFAGVKADGSFEIAVPGHNGQSFRFQVKDGASRSQPFDAVVSSAGDSLVELVAGPPCLVIEPSLWAAFDDADDERDLSIRNECSGVVTLSAPHLRRGRAGFSFEPASPIQLDAGEGATLTLHAGPGVESEDVLYLDVTGPTATHRAISLTIRDR